jgi:hypothetical protein
MSDDFSYNPVFTFDIGSYDNPISLEMAGNGSWSIASKDSDALQTMFKKAFLNGWIPAKPPQPTIWYPPAYRRLQSVLGPAFDTWMTCPASDVGCMVSFPLGVVITHLNDVHHWSKAKIATWVDGLELDLTVKPHTTHEE